MKTTNFPTPVKQVAREINDLSLLKVDQFRITFNRIDDSVFWAQEVTPPGIRLPSSKLPVGTSSVNMPSTMVETGDLEIEFLVDEYLSSWKSLYVWLYSMRDPEDMGSAPDDWRDEKSHCEIQLLDNALKPIGQFEFSGILPTEISPFPILSSKNRENQPPTFRGTFSFDNMKLTTRDELPDDVPL